MILYVVGESPTIGAIARFIGSQGTYPSKPIFYYHNDGHFIFKFQNIGERDRIIHNDPHMLNNKPVIVMPWSSEFNFYDEVPKTISLWVKFPKLPLNCWAQTL